ncbi:hypothetical protein JM16_009572 [Phytophthora kernoviae]|uniref:Uncharacterized protein n=1 Tax=Phytophthora kernoviae TaxID=325452 RepID=A0A8T0LI11_9STRA|nr:hypothetical protein JM16_009572 [Phytophthora kernoviae]
MSSSVTLPSVQGSRLAITIKNATFGYCINPNGPTTGLLILVIMLGLLCSLDLDLDLERLALIGAMALVALVLAQRLSSPPVQESQRSWTWAPIGIIKSYLRWARLLISPNADCPPTQESNDISSFGVTLQSSATAPTATTVPTTVTMTPHSPRELAIVVYDPTKASINTNWQTGSMAVSTVADITPAFATTLQSLSVDEYVETADIATAPVRDVHEERYEADSQPSFKNMESVPENDDNVAYLPTQLERKQQEIKVMQEQLEKYKQSNHELEQELSRVEKCNDNLVKKNQSFERNPKLVCAEVGPAWDLAHLFKDELAATRSKLEEYRQSSNKRERELDMELTCAKNHNEQLVNKNQVCEQDLKYVRGELKNARDQAHQFEDKHYATQAELQEYRQLSHEREQELEQELARAENHNGQLANKNQVCEQDLELVRCELDGAQDQAHRFEDELSAARAKLETATAACRRLEQEQDELQTRVRVLQATTKDLAQKLENEIEEKVFLATDQEELQRQHQVEVDRFHMEIMDLQSELYALQQSRPRLQCPAKQAPFKNMESVPENDDNVAYLPTQLERKQQEIKVMQEQLEKYKQSNHELEQELSRVEKCNDNLVKKNQSFERNPKLVCAEVGPAWDLAHLFKDELAATRSKLEEYRQSSNKRERELDMELTCAKNHNEQLVNKNQVCEQDLKYVRGELKNARDQAHQFEDKHYATQAELQEYRQLSHEREQELEQELARAENHNGQLANKSQRFERGLQLIRREVKAARELAYLSHDHLHTEDFKSEPHVLKQNRLHIKPVEPRVYKRSSKWQEQDAAGKARRQALESVASRLTDYLRDPRYLAHRANCKLHRGQDETRRR